MVFARSGLSHRAIAIVRAAYEVGRREWIDDARTARAWQGPADVTISYLAALRRDRLWNRPDRGW